MKSVWLVFADTVSTSVRVMPLLSVITAWFTIRVPLTSGVALSRTTSVTTPVAPGLWLPNGHSTTGRPALVQVAAQETNVVLTGTLSLIVTFGATSLPLTSHSRV